MTVKTNIVMSVLLCCWVSSITWAAEPDILIADFEATTYGEWTVQGNAFGPGPALGTLPGQMNVSGFEGKRLVNSFHQGDDSKGTLTSPAFPIQRPYINFLIGGGGFAEKTCIDLLVNGKVVRTAVGPNTVPGGSEALDWHSWDVADLVGQEATLRIVDQATGSWGHINIDQIVQSEHKIASETLVREIVVDQPHLHLPIQNGAQQRIMRLEVDGQLQRQFEIELAEGTPEFWMDTDVTPFLGKTLRIEVDRMRSDSQALQAIRLADRLPGDGQLYRERLRPQFHFSPARGWTNDPNGLVYYKGEYHLFFQHNPYGTQWGNMTWGHAISKDLVHWQQLPDALHPDELGTMFSGSGVVDQRNTTGWQVGEEKPLVNIYTSAGGTNLQSRGQPFTQSIAYSTDRGRTWIKYEKNPVLGNINKSDRDPKVFWHAPSQRWVMILYLDQRDHFALFSSPNLQSWKKLSDLILPEGHECPDLFELPVDGDPANTRWVAWEGGGRYLIGRFDGEKFETESGPHLSKFGANDYAAQTYSDIPSSDGRRIQISWMAGGRYPEMPFNQQMSVPRVLTLRTTKEGIRLFFEPVEEIKMLRQKQHRWQDVSLESETQELSEVQGELLDIEATVRVQDAELVGLEILGQKVEYSPEKRQISALGHSAPLDLGDGPLRLRILVDRASIEVFAGGGRVQLANCFVPDPANQRLAIYARGGTVQLEEVNVWEMQSIW